MDYCVSLGLVTRRQLADWGNSKKEVAEFFLSEGFQTSVKLVWEAIKKYCEAKKIRVKGLNQDIGKEIVRDAVKQSIISKLAEEYVKGSLEGRDWSEAIKLTLRNETWLKTTIIESASNGIASSIEGKKSFVETYKKGDIHISDSWIIEHDDSKKEIVTYSQEKLFQWAISEGVFARIQNLDEKVERAHIELRAYSFKRGIPYYAFAEVLDINVFFQRIKNRIAKELGNVWAEVKINGGDWDTSSSQILSDDEWLQKQINAISEFVMKRIDEINREDNDNGYCFGDCYNGSGRRVGTDDDEDRLHSI